MLVMRIHTLANVFIRKGELRSTFRLNMDNFGLQHDYSNRIFMNPTAEIPIDR